MLSGVNTESDRPAESPPEAIGQPSRRIGAADNSTGCAVGRTRSASSGRRPRQDRNVTLTWPAQLA